MEDKVLMELQDLLMSELKKITAKKDINPTELDNAKKAVCTIKDIEELMAMVDGMSEGYSNSRSMMPSRDYDVRFGRMKGSYRRGRDSDTGRYVSRRGSYNDYSMMEDGYSGHSIKDRMIAKLESMYDEAKTEHERQVVDQWISRLEMES